MSTLCHANIAPNKDRAEKISEQQKFRREQRREQRRDRKEKDKIRTQFRTKQQNMKYSSPYYSSDEEPEDFGEVTDDCDDGAKCTVKRDNYHHGNNLYGLYCIHCPRCIDDYGEITYVVSTMHHVHYCKRCQSVLATRLARPIYEGSVANNITQNQQQFYETVLARNPFYIQE